jgi:hypothetical protein
MPFLAFPSEKVLAEFQSVADLTDLHDPRRLIAVIYLI